ncbi:metallophosphoesterase [Candidatus Woesearchaeota archaeon]|nr:metallophosphoesterase [Candidatus Woesearchaeota archaeon]
MEEGLSGQGPEEAVWKKRSVREFLKRKMLVSPEFLGSVKEISSEEFRRITESNSESAQSVLVIDKKVDELLKRNEPGINWLELEKSKVMSEKRRKLEAYGTFLDTLLSPPAGPSLPHTATTHPPPSLATPEVSGTPRVKVVFSYSANPVKREMGDFVSYYLARYKAAQGILMQHSGLSSLVQISRLRSWSASNSGSEQVSVIGMVVDRQQTKQGHLAVSVEDPTGTIDVIINKTRKELFETASNLVFDEVVAISGTLRSGTLFAANIVLPDVPAREPKYSPTEGYAVFMSDLHFGSAQFLEADFRKFLKWINGGLGNPSQREIAGKVKYVLIAGDVVDGVGVYQDQYDELSVKDVRDQYKMCAEFLSEIPQNIKIILSPGNHDAVRAAEPQDAFSGDFAAPLLKLPNVVCVSNPAVVNIDASEGFPGFDVLLYHGYSFDYYVANVDSIRQQGGYERADLIMRFLLQRRHLAPAHTSTLILPDRSSDPLFINIVPDIFATGHIHRTSVSDYKGITLINSSCWQGKTKFQERLGHSPQPSRLPVFNLKTRAAKIINFGK